MNIERHNLTIHSAIDTQTDLGLRDETGVVLKLVPSLGQISIKEVEGHKTEMHRSFQKIPMRLEIAERGVKRALSKKGTYRQMVKMGIKESFVLDRRTSDSFRKN